MSDILKKIEDLNGAVKDWANTTKQQALFRINQLNLRETGELYRKVKVKLRKRDLEVERVVFQFPAQGFYAELGVGRGNPIEKIQAGGGSRKAKVWISEVLDKREEALGDIVAEIYADDALKKAADLNIKRTN